MRTVQELSREEIESILHDANRRCYAEIAEEVDVPVYTIRKVIRQHNNQLRRYQHMGGKQ